MQTEYFSQNLRNLILEKYTSLSSGAQAIGINRQQLNKYLKGTNQPSVEILKRIASALNVSLDMLLMSPENHQTQHVKSSSSSNILDDKFINNYKKLSGFSQTNHKALSINCGNYLIYHRAGFLKDHLLIGFSQIYQHNCSTFMSTLMSFDGESRTSLLPRTYRYDAVVMLNSGCLHCFRMNSLAGAETDMGLMILRPKRLAADKHLFGHALTTGLSTVGSIAHSEVVLEQVHGHPLGMFRKHCGLWRSDENRFPKAVRDHLKL